jgi:hypothetical protein
MPAAEAGTGSVVLAREEAIIPASAAAVRVICCVIAVMAAGKFHVGDARERDIATSISIWRRVSFSTPPYLLNYMPELEGRKSARKI